MFYSQVALFRRCRAFTLVEVVIAFAIFAFCIVVIMGLLSNLMTSSRESWMETRSAQIARQIMNDLTPDPGSPSGAVDRATAGKGILILEGGNSVQLPLSPTNAFITNAFYTTDGAPVDESSTNVFFEATIAMKPVVMEPAAGVLPQRLVTQLQIEIQPAGQTNTRPFRFVTRITAQEL